MRLPRLSPSVDRRTTTSAPVAPVRGDAVTPQICSLKLCDLDSDCNGNGSCTQCNMGMGICVIP
jgi:hypothetical protein